MKSYLFWYDLHTVVFAVHANARFRVQEKKKDNFASNIDILKTKLMPYPVHP